MVCDRGLLKSTSVPTGGTHSREERRVVSGVTTIGINPQYGRDSVSSVETDCRTLRHAAGAGAWA